MAIAETTLGSEMLEIESIVVSFLVKPRLYSSQSVSTYQIESLTTVGPCHTCKDLFQKHSEMSFSLSENI